MDITQSFKICGAGMAASRTKLDVVSSNLANAEVTRTPEGGPYRKKTVVLTSEEMKGQFDEDLNDALKLVKVESIAEEVNGTRMVYDPAHPDADAKGMVSFPNVNVVQEMADMITAGRAFDACATAFDATKNMALKSMELGK